MDYHKYYEEEYNNWLSYREFCRKIGLSEEESKKRFVEALARSAIVPIGLMKDDIENGNGNSISVKEMESRYKLKRIDDRTLQVTEKINNFGECARNLEKLGYKYQTGKGIFTMENAKA
ncbi:MAG: hypothetical protein QW292_11005 [Candidatus Parvarchaeota archaeon]